MWLGIIEIIIGIIISITMYFKCVKDAEELERLIHKTNEDAEENNT